MKDFVKEFIEMIRCAERAEEIYNKVFLPKERMHQAQEYRSSTRLACIIYALREAGNGVSIEGAVWENEMNEKFVKKAYKWILRSGYKPVMLGREDYFNYFFEMHDFGERHEQVRKEAWKFYVQNFNEHAPYPSLLKSVLVVLRDLGMKDEFLALRKTYPCLEKTLMWQLAQI